MFTTQEQAANCGITVTPKFNLQIAFSMLMATQVERCPVVFFFYLASETCSDAIFPV